MKLNTHIHTHIGMNIRIVFAYDSIFYVNIEYEYAYRGTVCVWGCISDPPAFISRKNCEHIV